MATLKKYDLKGKAIGEASIDDALLDVKANSQSMKDYLVALHHNARQWSASTKTRSEVSHTGKKPHAQKGLGRARQGSLASPQYKGGGRVFGPKPKFDQNVRINQKERRMAIRHLLKEKISQERVHILKSNLKKPKTKEVFEFLSQMNLDGKRVLFLAPTSDKNNEVFWKSIRNLSKTHFILAPNLNGYQLAICQDIFVLDGAFDEVLALFEKGAKNEK